MVVWNSIMPLLFNLILTGFKTVVSDDNWTILELSYQDIDILKLSILERSVWLSDEENEV